MFLVGLQPPCCYAWCDFPELITPAKSDESLDHGRTRRPKSFTEVSYFAWSKNVILNLEDNNDSSHGATITMVYWDPLTMLSLLYTIVIVVLIVFISLHSSQRRSACR